MDGADSESHLHHPFKFTPLLIGLIGIVVGSVMVALYQCMAIGFNHSRGTGLSPTPFQIRRRPNTVITTGSSDGRAMGQAQAMSVYKHTKGSEEGTCAVCLSEFGEGEEIRTLPQCMHSFHAPCIDMWLYSHSNCPLCRTHTSRIPPPPPPPPPPPRHLALAVSSPDEARSPEPERSAALEEA